MQKFPKTAVMVLCGCVLATGLALGPARAQDQPPAVSGEVVKVDFHCAANEKVEAKIGFDDVVVSFESGDSACICSQEQEYLKAIAKDYIIAFQNGAIANWETKMRSDEDIFFQSMRFYLKKDVAKFEMNLYCYDVYSLQSIARKLMYND